MQLDDIGRLIEPTEDRAVSPIIGVILMVAITVILAAIIGTFVLGLGSGIQTTPQASFEFEYDGDADGLGNDSIAVTHMGGDNIQASRLSAVVTDAKNAGSALDTTYVDIYSGLSDGTVSAADKDTINKQNFSSVTGSNDELWLNESTVNIVFEREEGPETAILATFTGPDS